MSDATVRGKPGPPPGFGYKGEREALTVRVPVGTKNRLEVLKAALGYHSVSDLVSEMVVDAMPGYESGLAAHQKDSSAQKMT